MSIKITTMNDSTSKADWFLLNTATRMAIAYHREQLRKGTDIPYLSHLFAVTSIVLDHGGDASTAAAAMLHDAAEDQGGEQVLAAIDREINSHVAAIVRECSDSLTQPKPPWRQRKEKAIASVPAMMPESCLVKAADTLHNVRSMHREYQQQGESFWEKFRGGRDGTLWFHTEISQALAQRVDEQLSAELLAAVDRLLKAAESA